MQKEHIENFITAANKNDKETALESFNAALMNKISVKLEDMKINVANQYFNLKNESVDLDESKEFMQRAHLEHIAKHIATHKNDSEFHRALKSFYYQQGKNLNSNFREDYFKNAADGEGKGSPKSKNILPTFTKNHKEHLNDLVDNHFVPEHLKQKAKDFHNSIMSKGQ